MADKIEWGGTVGPWFGGNSYTIFSGEHGDIADVLTDEIDARAIAEVPAMVQALRRLVERADSMVEVSALLHNELIDAMQILARIDGAA